jgi:hypothetical protein
MQTNKYGIPTISFIVYANGNVSHSLFFATDAYILFVYGNHTYYGEVY